MRMEPFLTCVAVNNDFFTLPSESLTAMQAFATPEEKKQWMKAECKLEINFWLSTKDKPCLPKHFFPHYPKLVHGLGQRFSIPVLAPSALHILHVSLFVNTPDSDHLLLRSELRA